MQYADRSKEPIFIDGLSLKEMGKYKSILSSCTERIIKQLRILQQNGTAVGLIFSV
jgi:hypothetical protein